MCQKARLSLGTTSPRVRRFMAQFRRYVTTCAYVHGPGKALRPYVCVSSWPSLGITSQCVSSWPSLGTTTQCVGTFMAQFVHYVTKCA